MSVRLSVKIRIGLLEGRSRRIKLRQHHTRKSYEAYIAINTKRNTNTKCYRLLVVRFFALPNKVNCNIHLNYDSMVDIKYSTNSGIIFSIVLVNLYIF